jgi:hypothetical protein
LPEDFGGVHWLGECRFGFVALGKNGLAVQWRNRDPSLCWHFQFRSPCIEVISDFMSDFIFFRLQNREMHSFSPVSSDAMPQPIECPEGVHITDLSCRSKGEVPVILSDGSAAFLDATRTKVIPKESLAGDVYLCAATCWKSYAFAGLDKTGQPFLETAEGRQPEDIQSIHMSRWNLIFEFDDGNRYRVQHAGFTAEDQPHDCFGSMPAIPPSNDGLATRAMTAFSSRVGKGAQSAKELRGCHVSLKEYSRAQRAICRAAGLRAVEEAPLVRGLESGQRTWMLCESDRIIPGLEKFMIPAGSAEARPAYRIPLEMLRLNQ